MEQTKNSRRLLLKGLGLGAITGSFDVTAAQEDSGTGFKTNYDNKPMTITKVEGIRFSDKVDVGGGSGGSGRTEFCWVRIYTDAGIVGIGETYPGINGELGALK